MQKGKKIAVNIKQNKATQTADKIFENDFKKTPIQRKNGNYAQSCETAFFL